MNRFVKGVIAGSIIGISGALVLGSDRRSRRHMMKTGRHAMRRAGDLVDDVKDMWA